MNTSKVWYVTGASQGLGLVLVKKLLENGHRVAATSRNAQVLKDAVEVIGGDRFLALNVDLNSRDSIASSISQTLSAFGRIDVLVNNAGYGMVGALEEISDDEIRRLIEVNLVATINVTKAILPTMRSQLSGQIFNIGSVAGFVGAPGWSVYSATKAAVAAFSEVLALDLKEFGIHVTVVEPSGFRTNFLTKDSLAIADTKIEGYDAIRQTKERYLAMNGKQPGDPDKAAEILMKLSDNPAPPVHLFLGADAYNRASAKIAGLADELEKWKQEAVGADFK